MNLDSLYDKFFATYPIYQRFRPIKSFRDLHDWLWFTEIIHNFIDGK
ncbi:hypothetical protein EP10_003529 [Geobacillus icigianus]|uniref:IS5/IS1182 family transposase n=1 Tax=Geobacillus icigianus TaxID=1430331 RepID=A0ABU6BLR7_9BACL|nr:hypothetical protein [Geobacillus icigianus]